MTVNISKYISINYSDSPSIDFFAPPNFKLLNRDLQSSTI